MSKSIGSISRRRLLQGSAAVCLLSVSRVGFGMTSEMVAVRIWPASAYTRITLESSVPLKFKQFSLSNPDRIVVDIEGVSLNSVLKDIGEKVRVNDPFIQKARVGQFNANTVRLVLDLKQTINPKLFTLKPFGEFKDRLVIDLYPAVEDEEDPLLALLEEYNKGEAESVIEQPAKPGKAGKDRDLIVMIDPGHGGEDSGAIGHTKSKEKDLVLQISRRLRDLIKAQPKMKAILTRDEDVFIPLGVRVAKARQQRADLFISIHADAFTKKSARGSSVFALSTKGATSAAAKMLAQTQNDADLIGGVSRSGDTYLDQTLFDLVQTATINDSLKFGHEVLSRIGKLNKLHKGAVEQAGFAVLKAPDIPSILVETAFISNPAEEKKLKSAAFQKQIASAILGGIKAYIEKTAA